MTDNLLKLRKIISKTFRKAKRWYSAYLLCQFAVLIFAVSSIFSELNPNLSAVIAFLAVLATETLRWRSDCWKSEGEAALRRWEKADGLGITVDRTDIADWLAAKPKGFLADVGDADVQGSEFDSGQTRGPLRLLKNTQESAWWSKHLSSRMVVYLGVILLLIVVAAFIALTFCIGSLKNTSAQPTVAVVQNIAGIICSVLVFVFSINLVRLLLEFWTFAREAKETLGRCAELLNRTELAERDALSVLHDYQTARNSAPLLPTFVWKFHCNHLREQWADFRPEPGT
jgi:hypothetical protein